MLTSDAEPEVRVFNQDHFFDALSGPRFSRGNAENHAQARYLFGYLQDVNAVTMVVEEEYVDADYLADFASYYVSCFERYERFCRRVHFFQLGFDVAHFARAMLGQASPEEMHALQTGYLGFIVVRPLPDAVIGRTALRPYPSDGGRRNYTALVPYAVSLYGVDLQIVSLAYQEQDTVLAACATVALWSALHRTAYVYRTRAPRPPIITADATRTILYNRALPSTGLRLEQMMAAIRAADLDPYAYNRGGLPIILIVHIAGLGQHAVTIVGFSLQNGRVFRKELPDALVVKDANGADTEQPVKDFPPMRGLRINEFYAHDDGVGPFSRLVVKQPGPGPHRITDASSRTRFDGQWYFPGSKDVREMLPTCVSVPVYQKIRLHFDVVMAWMNRLHPAFNAAATVAQDRDRVEWDVYIIETKDYKREIVGMALTDARKLGLLKSSQPRFIWRMAFSVDGVPVAECLLDATSFSKAFPVFLLNWFDDGFAKRVEAIVRTGHLKTMLTPSLENLILREIDQRETDKIGMPRI